VSNTSLATIVHTARKAKGWSLQRVADEARALGHSVTPQAINEIELGHTEQPTIRMLTALSEVLDLSMAQLAIASYATAPQEVPA
jgi:transcriptional regulator with XRE-family HTH domain